jgi:hypothetical protein
MENIKISIPESKHFCEYACSQSSSGFVAKLLNLEPSRVSEVKRGTRRLKMEEANTLREHFGIPTSNPGYFYHGMVIDDVDFDRRYRPGSGASHMMYLLRFFSDSSNISVVLNGFNLETDTKIVNNEQYAAKLFQLNKLLESDGFNSWVTIMKSKLSSFDARPNPLYRNVIDKYHKCKDDNLGLKKLSESLVEYAKREFDIIFINSNDEYIANQLLLIGCVKQTLEEGKYPDIAALNESFELGNIECGYVPEDVVINGRAVWESRDDLVPTKASGEFAFNWIPNTKNEVFDIGYALRSLNGVNDGEWNSPDLAKTKSIFPPRYGSAKISLIWSESYNYFIKIGLNEGVPDTADDDVSPYYCTKPYEYIIVKVSKTDQIFSELMRIIKSLGIDEIEVDDIKRVVALNGGFIPNAKYVS